MPSPANQRHPSSCKTCRKLGRPHGFISRLRISWLPIMTAAFTKNVSSMPMRRFLICLHFTLLKVIHKQRCAIRFRLYSQKAWLENILAMIIRLAKLSASKTAVEGKLPAFIDKYTATMLEPHDLKLRPWLQPTTKIHLHPQGNEIESGSNMNDVYIFSAIAFLTLLIASINLASFLAISRFWQSLSLASDFSAWQLFLPSDAHRKLAYAK